MTAARWTAVAMAATGAVGVTCQFLQGTDPRFPLVYFTVGSAVLATVAAIAVGASAPIAGPLLLASTPSVLLSAIVFAAVIAPTQNGGPWFAPQDDAFVRVAIAAMHGLLPLLAVFELRLQRRALLRRTTRAWVVASLPWPVIYALGTAAVQGAGWASSPYPFLRPSEVGWGVVAASVVGAAALIPALAVGLRRITERGGT